MCSEICQLPKEFCEKGTCEMCEHNTSDGYILNLPNGWYAELTSPWYNIKPKNEIEPSERRKC